MKVLMGARGVASGAISELCMRRNNMEKEKARPVYDRRLAGVRLAIWENVTEAGKVWFNVSLNRHWVDSTGEWRDASTFCGLQDLLLVQELVAAAKAWISERELLLGTNAD
jgi:hypothetical protein